MGRVAGVIGWPVHHSLSPKLHRYWLEYYGIDGEYLAQAVEPEALAATLKSLPARGWWGCNLTLPHKEAALALADSLDETAKAIGAINTIVVQASGKLHGANTDAYGFIENIRPLMPEKRNKAIILGAGGAARAICYALIREGFRCVVINRTYARTQQLRKQFGEAVAGEPWESRGKALEGADLLVNATSLGMAGREPLDMDLALLPETALVTDIVYAPLITPLLEQAKARGNPVVDGLGMLLHQAVPAFEAWFDVRPEVTDQLREYILR